MGVTLWAAIAVTLAAAVAVLGYRASLSYRSVYPLASPSGSATQKALATGDATPEETTQWTKTLFSIAASTGQYQKAIDYGKTMVDNGTATNDNLAFITQSYYLLKDCKDSGIWADKAIAAARKAGETPKENLYLFKLQCASDSGDTAAMDAVLMDLIKLNNKTTYWNTLLRIERQDERDDHNTLMIYRIEMAQLLGDAALPGEAAAVLDKAMAAGIIKDEHNKKSLLREEVEASQNPAGELLVELGEVYYGFGDYHKTIDVINLGLQKGQVTQTDEALVYLGLAQLQLKSYAEAKKTFAGIPAAPNVSARSARLWRLYAATLYAG